MVDLSSLSDQQKVQLVSSRWESSSTVWDTVKKLYDTNLKIYQNQPRWIDNDVALKNRTKIRANRIFRDMESVINALIANPPQPNFIPTRETKEAAELAELQQAYFVKKYKDLNVKEQVRKGLRNLYFGRLIVLKPFWNTKINDFDVRAIDPRKIRVSINSTKEDDTDFAIEEVSDTLMSVIARFPKQAPQILQLNGFKDEKEAYIQNPSITYKEAWIGTDVLFVYGTLLLGQLKNPYWDWDGLLVTAEEERELKTLGGEARRNMLSEIRQMQPQRQPAPQQTPQAPQGQADEGVMAKVRALFTGAPQAPDALGQQVQEEKTEGIQEVSAEPNEPQEELHAYYFNHFDYPRKPYIFATIFNNENTPIGQTDFITQAAPLQEGIDRRKQDIDENASLVNGTIKVDSTVMSKADAQKLRFQARGIIWGKNVATGVTREMGNPLPQFVYEDMVDSRNEIDNIMAASSAFRGEREGVETKAGRLALIDQSYLALNELVQVVDYTMYELFNWFYQLAKVRYTEHHEAKLLGKDNALKVFTLMQDDFEDGTELKIIAGKTLPEDRQFKYEQAQTDFKQGALGLTDYLEIAGYDAPTEKAKNTVSYHINPAVAVGMSPEEIQQIAPQQAPEEKPPSTSISFKDLPPDGQIQLGAKAGLELNPQILIAEKMQEQRSKREKDILEAERTRAKMEAPKKK